MNAGTAKIAVASAFVRERHNGHTYTTTVHRGTEYTLRAYNGAWELTTRRLALGRGNMGGFKRFDAFAAVLAGCKAFEGLDIINAI